MSVISDAGSVQIARQIPHVRTNLRQYVEVGVASAAVLLIADRAAAHTGPAHWAHARVHWFLHKCLGYGRCG